MNGLSKNTKTALGVVICILCIAAVAVSWKHDRRRNPKLHVYPVAAQENFLDMCEGSNKTTPCMCECLLKDYRTRFTYQEFQDQQDQIQRQALTDASLKWLHKAMTHCTQYSIDICSVDTASSH